MQNFLPNILMGGSKGVWFPISVPIVSKYQFDICQNEKFSIPISEIRQNMYNF